MVLTSAHLRLDAQKKNVSEKLQSPALAYGRQCTEGIGVGPEMPSLPSLEGPRSGNCQTPQSTSLLVFGVPRATAGGYSWEPFPGTLAYSGSGDADCLESFQDHFHFRVDLCLRRILLSFPSLKNYLFHVCAFAHVCMHVCGCVGVTVCE